MRWFGILAEFGGRGRARTADILGVNEALFQLSYAPWNRLRGESNGNYRGLLAEIGLCEPGVGV